jgi:hypothetical protein
MSKPALEMTMAEMQYLLHIHEFSSETERVNALAHFEGLRRIVEFIEERIHATPALPCDCFYCEGIRTAKPKRAAAPAKIKEPPVTFSLDG